MADYQGPYTGAQVDAALKAATELQPKVKEIEDAVTLQGTKTSLNEAEIGQLKDSKADKEGYYSSLVAGAAENLINTSGDGVVRELTYDTAGGTADIGTGTAIIKRMRGKSLVWNQQYPTGWSKTAEGITSTSVNGEISVIGTTTATYFRFEPFSANIANHKYLFTLSGASSALEGKRFGLPNRGAAAYGIVTQGFAYLFYLNSNASSQRNMGIQDLSAGITLDEKVVICQHDLTQMFGAGNEPATIEEFKRLFPRDDYAYNEGEVIHFNGRRLLTTGFNQWDEQWEPGEWSLQNGGAYAKADAIRSKNYIPVVGGRQYNGTCLKGNNIGIVLYDAEFKFLTSTVNSITTPSNACYAKIFAGGSYGATYNHDICFNLSWSGYRNGEYEPYEEHILELPYGVYGDGLKSVGDVYDEVTEERYVKRIGVVDMGTLDWRYDNERRFIADFSGMQAANNLPNITNSYGYYASLKPINPEFTHLALCYYSSRIYLYNELYTDAASFKAAMAGVMLYYELAEPEVTEFETPLNLGYYVNDFGTEMILPENGIAPFTAPAVFDILYAMNAVDTLRNLPTNYISKESFDNFTAALSSALANAGITMSIKATFNEETGAYTYTITASKSE